MTTTTHPDDTAKYWPYYCEENVWHLCHALPEADTHSLVAVVSNAAQSVAMWEQRAAAGDGPILWDYHVLLLRADESGWRVVDLDSRLGSDVEADRYLRESFRPLPRGRESLAPRFRLIPAETYRFALHSDRRHMRGPSGEWRAEPPPWPPIGEGSNLAEFVAMDGPFLGRVVELETLREMMAGPTR